MTDGISRRGPLAKCLGLGLGWGLSACGGGSSADGDAPTVQRLDAGEARIGEPVALTPVVSGGQGRIEPDLGPVRSGEPVLTPPLAGPRRYTLVVEAPGRPSARRELLQPGYRDRYVAVPDAPWLQYHAALAAPDGAVIVIGGSRGLNTLSEAIDRFDPATRRFTRLGQMYTGRAMHSATLLADGRVLILGGDRADGGATGDALIYE
ncbi:MAG: kelch repeat-containing protein [Roseateles sp.]